MFIHFTFSLGFWGLSLLLTATLHTNISRPNPLYLHILTQILGSWFCFTATLHTNLSRPNPLYLHILTQILGSWITSSLMAVILSCVAYQLTRKALTPHTPEGYEVCVCVAEECVCVRVW
jgi:hypothetical protein